MARKKPRAKTSTMTNSADEKRRKNAERSAYFARRQAAKILRTVLEGDARRRAVASVKSLVYSPSVRNKKATYALVCQTLKYLPIIKEVMDAANVLNSRWKRQRELVHIIVYDILFGQEASLVGDAEKYLLKRKDALKSALARLSASKGVKDINGLEALYKIADTAKPRYVRVNTLKLDAESALLELKKHYAVSTDQLVPDLLVLPSGTDLHGHPFIKNGNLFMQGKASSMVAAALAPKPGWEVVDACAAPGNKTVHLAAIMRGKGRIIACELDKKRFERLKDTITLAGARNVKCKHGDFLDLNPQDPSFSKVRAILLDPSCSGSGTVADRLDHLLPSYNGGVASAGELNRLAKLAAFQKKALEHALSFPAVERIVYSTCSINQVENEDVVKFVMPLAESHGFKLATVFPSWPRRGLPVLHGSEHLLRTDLSDDKEGFFIALFVTKKKHNHLRQRASSPNTLKLSCKNLHRKKKTDLSSHELHQNVFVFSTSQTTKSTHEKGLTRLRRRQLLNGDSQHSVLTHSRDGVGVGVLRQDELPHELPDPPLHPNVLGGAFLLFLPLPLSGDEQHVVVLHLDLDVAGLEPRHVNDEDVRVRALLHVRRSRRHRLGVSHVGHRRSIDGLVVGIVQGVHHVLQGVEDGCVQTH